MKNQKRKESKTKKIHDVLFLVYTVWFRQEEPAKSLGFQYTPGLCVNVIRCPSSGE